MKRPVCLSLLVLLASLILAPVSSRAAELVIVPGDALVLNQTNANRNYFDAVVHAILIAAEPDEHFTVQSLQIVFLQDGTPLLTKIIPIERVVGETREIGEMVGHGLSVLLNAQLLAADGPSGLLGREITLATEPQLYPNQALVTGRHHVSLDFAADEVRVTASLLWPDGTTTMLVQTVPVQLHDSAITYSSPLGGVWLSTASASIEGHHRLNPGTEFAVDFFKLDAGGQIHNGDPARAENYFGFDAPVMAAAEGEVVFVIADDVQDRTRMQPRDGESPNDARRRARMTSMRNMATDFRRAMAGNIVVLRHEYEGQVEYSSYGHLAAGSVTLVPGDSVQRGEVIGRVGDTGDSPTVHLHFQINAGSDPFTSKSLPVLFDNLTHINRGVDPLRFVQAPG